MENASKALIMAGSVLMAILVISLLVLGYNQLSNYEQTKTDSEINDKMAEYMRRFEQFNRGEGDPIYGSELLSLANLQEDYNLSDAREDVGYDEIIIKVTITKPIVGSTYFLEGTHDISDLAKDKNSLEEEISNYEEKESDYNNKSVKYFANKTNREIAVEFGMNPPSDMTDYDILDEYLLRNNKTKKLIEAIYDYSNLKAIYNEFRTGKLFACTKVEYNDGNGRLNRMEFEEI